MTLTVTLKESDTERMRVTLKESESDTGTERLQSECEAQSDSRPDDTLSLGLSKQTNTGPLLSFMI